MKKILNEIIAKIKTVNDERLKYNANVISEDDTDEEINWILIDFFQEDKADGIDIDSYDFLENKFGRDVEAIREAEAGIYK